MDYSKMDRAQLIKKLEDQKHLADAIEAKDVEIAELKKMVDAQKDYYDIKKENETLKSGKEHQRQIDDLKDQHKKIIEQKAAEFKMLVDTFNLRMKQMNEFINTHGSLLKSLQGTLDVHLSLNEKMIQEVFPPKKETEV